MLVEGTLAPYVCSLRIRQSNFLWFHHLKVESRLSNGAVLGGDAPPSGTNHGHGGPVEQKLNAG